MGLKRPAQLPLDPRPSALPPQDGFPSEGLPLANPRSPAYFLDSPQGRVRSLQTGQELTPTFQKGLDMRAQLRNGIHEGAQALR